MKEKADKIWEIISSSTRPMPAHFTSGEDGRVQSFCVEYADLSADDEYEMASESYYTAGELPVSESEVVHLCRCGEDLMLVGYLTTKEKVPEAERELFIKVVVTATAPVRPSVLDLPEVKKYFVACVLFGRQRASLGAKATSPYLEKQAEASKDSQ